MSEVGRARLISGKKTECDFFSKPYLNLLNLFSDENL